MTNIFQWLNILSKNLFLRLLFGQSLVRVILKFSNFSLGALKAGGAVSLMDPTYPAERIINCMKVAEPKAWLMIEAAGEPPKEVEEYLKKNNVNIQLSIPGIWY